MTKLSPDLRGEIITAMVSSQVQALQEDTSYAMDLLRNGHEGYAMLSDEALIAEFFGLGLENAYPRLAEQLPDPEEEGAA